jgi:hypothetical protein
VVAVKPMAAPAGGGDRVAEREVLKRAGSLVVVVVCLLKRPKTLVAGIAAAGQGRLGPTRLIQGSSIFACLWVARRTAGQRQRVQTAVEMQEQLRPEQGCVNECLSRPGKL